MRFHADGSAALHAASVDCSNAVEQQTEDDANDDDDANS